MIGMYKQNDNISSYVSEFICDTEADVMNLPTEKNKVYPGSTAIVATTGEVYILNASRQWVVLGSGVGPVNPDVDPENPANGYDYATKEDIDALFPDAKA